MLVGNGWVAVVLSQDHSGNTADSLTNANFGFQSFHGARHAGAHATDRRTAC